jgi:hypothetical protein
MLLLQLWGGARSRILTTLKRFAALLAPGVGAESTEMEQPLVRFNTASRVSFCHPERGRTTKLLKSTAAYNCHP